MCGNACVFVSLWVLLLVCVGDLFLTRFLCCQSILCVSDYLSSQALSSPRPNHATAVAFPSLSLSLSFFLTSANPLSLLLSFLSLSGFLIFSLSFSWCILPERWYLGFEVGGFFDLFILFFVFILSFLKAFNHQTTNVDLHEISVKPGCSFHL